MRLNRTWLSALGGVALFAPAVTLAQAPACTLPETLPRPHPVGPTDREPKRLLPTAGYTLALSWAPEYCRTHGGSAGDETECGSANHFGFTLHGLWPDGPGKEWPQYCRPADLLPESVIRANLCATPSAQLLQHEWAKHGTCLTASPVDYFARSTHLYSGIAFPEMAALSRRKLTVASFASAFAAANRGMTGDMIRLNVNRKGWLEEVWLCLGTDFAPRRCPATAGGAAPTASLKIENGQSPGASHRWYARKRARS